MLKWDEAIKVATESIGLTMADVKVHDRECLGHIIFLEEIHPGSCEKHMITLNIFMAEADVSAKTHQLKPGMNHLWTNLNYVLHDYPKYTHEMFKIITENVTRFINNPEPHHL